jgi:hypothetical protein
MPPVHRNSTDSPSEIAGARREKRYGNSIDAAVKTLHIALADRLCLPPWLKIFSRIVRNFRTRLLPYFGRSGSADANRKQTHTNITAVSVAEAGDTAVAFLPVHRFENRLVVFGIRR